MSIYTSNQHRKIYEQYYGPIGKDNNGRSLEVHHIDGNHFNNHISNLKLVTIEEHYDIHYAQGDWAACRIIAERADISPEVKSWLSSMTQRKLLENGTHHFLGPELNKRTLQNGTHSSFSEVAREKNRQSQLRIIAEGKNVLVGGKIQKKLLAAGKHPSQVKWTCQECNHSGQGKGNLTMHRNKFCSARS